LDALTRLEEFTAFDELDWHSVASEIATLEDERRALEAASDLLKELNRQLAELQQIRVDTERELGAARERRAKVEQRQADAESLRATTLALVDAAPIDPALVPQLKALCAEVLGEPALTVESCDNREKEVRDLLQTRIDAEDRRLARL